MPWTLGLARDLREVGGGEHALAHLVAALRVLGEREIVGDEHEAEGFRALQLLEQGAAAAASGPAACWRATRWWACWPFSSSTGWPRPRASSADFQPVLPGFRM